MLKGVRHDFLSNFFLSRRTKNFAGNPSVLCFRKFLVPNNFMDKMRGVSIFSVEKFLSHSAEKIRRCPFSVSLI